MQVPASTDPDVAALLGEVGGDDEPLRGTFFINDAREMLRATREIERAARERGTTVYVGFQDAARLDDETKVYDDLVEHSRVIGYGVGQPKFDTDRMEWIAVPRDRHALHNQWFLVLRGDEDLAFVGYETSPPKSFRKGPSYNEERTWEGFTTGDERLITHLVDRLDHVRKMAARAPTSWYLAATDDGTDPRYAAVRAAALQAAQRDDAGLVLYDRTTESYLTNPYPSGPWSDMGDALSPTWDLSPARLDAIGRGYLAQQLRDVDDHDVPVTAHLAVDRGGRALRAAVDRHRPDRVFLPVHLTTPSLLDRVRGNTLAAMAEAVDVPIDLVDTDGAVSDTIAP